MTINKNFFYAILVILPFLLYGCGGSQQGQTAGAGPAHSGSDFSAPIPKELQKNTFVNLEATLNIENVGAFPLNVDLDGTGVCGSVGVCATIEDIPEGSYTFTIRYLINSTEVVRSVTTGTVSPTTPLALNFPVATYPDTDGDGFTNLAEIETGFDPLLASSRPPAEIPRFSTSYTLVDSTGFGFMTTENITSPNYTIKPSL